MHEKVTPIMFFIITAEFQARSLANFNSQYADRHESEIHAYREKQIDVSF